MKTALILTLTFLAIGFTNQAQANLYKSDSGNNISHNYGKTDKRIRIFTNSESYKTTVKIADKLAQHHNINTPIVEVVGQKAIIDFFVSANSADLVVSPTKIIFEDKNLLKKANISEKFVKTAKGGNIYIYSKNSNSFNYRILNLFTAIISDKNFS